MKELGLCRRMCRFELHSVIEGYYTRTVYMYVRYVLPPGNFFRCSSEGLFVYVPKRLTIDWTQDIQLDCSVAYSDIALNHSYWSFHEFLINHVCFIRRRICNPVNTKSFKVYLKTTPHVIIKNATFFYAKLMF